MLKEDLIENLPLNVLVMMDTMRKMELVNSVVLNVKLANSLQLNVQVVQEWDKEDQPIFLTVSVTQDFMIRE